jgi:hypothetical protein
MNELFYVTGIMFHERGVQRLDQLFQLHGHGADLCAAIFGNHRAQHKHRLHSLLSGKGAARHDSTAEKSEVS